MPLVTASLIAALDGINTEMSRLYEAGRLSVQSLEQMKAVMDTPEWRRWMVKERWRDRYRRRYARGPR